MAYRGKSLKALRESKRIRLRRISNETRINMAYLEDPRTNDSIAFPASSISRVSPNSTRARWGSTRLRYCRLRRSAKLTQVCSL